MNKEQTIQEIMDLTSAWTVAELHGDTTFLGNTLADDFIGIGPLGFLLTRPEWIARHQSGDLQYKAFNLDDINVRLYNDTAILIGHQTQDATYRGNSMPAQFRMTLVFVKRDQWQLANLQLSSIGQPPQFARS